MEAAVREYDAKLDSKKGGITIVGLEPHPEDKSNGYKKVTLSAMGKETT